MNIPSGFIVAAAVIAAVPFGWGLGVVAAMLIVGPDFGVFPVLTIPPAIIAAVAFALSRKLKPTLRLGILLAGTALFFLLF